MHQATPAANHDDVQNAATKMKPPWPEKPIYPNYTSPGPPNKKETKSNYGLGSYVPSRNTGEIMETETTDVVKEMSARQRPCSCIGIPCWRHGVHSSRKGETLGGPL